MPKTLLLVPSTVLVSFFFRISAKEKEKKVRIQMKNLRNEKSQIVSS